VVAVSICSSRPGVQSESHSAHGGVALGSGRGGTEFTIGRGFSVVVGSEGADTVHVWGGLNLIFLRSGDDKVVAHDGGGLSIVFGGAGTDSVSCVGACWTTWTGPDIELRSRNDAPAPSSSLVVLGVPRTHRSLLALDDEICDDAVSGSGSPIQQYGVEVWGVLDGADAGPEVTAYLPGGNFSWDDGTSKQSFAHWGRPPSLGEPRIFRLHRSDQLGVWIFERAEDGYGVGDPIPLSLMKR